MKYSFMTFSIPNLSWDDIVSFAAKHGYDGVEPRIDSGHAHGIEVSSDAATRAEAQQKAIDAGIGISCIATSLRYVVPPDVGENVDYTRRCIDLAADVGAPVIRVFGGNGVLEAGAKDGLPRDEAADVIVKTLTLVADHAEARGVTVCMETHDHWIDPKYLVPILQRVNHPSIAINWDIMHPVIYGGLTTEEAFRLVKPWIRHVHFHDGKLECEKLVFLPIGTGLVDHKTAFRLLASIDYKGYLSGEWFAEDYEDYLPRELATMRAYEREVGA